MSITRINTHDVLMITSININKIKIFSLLVPDVSNVVNRFQR